MERRLLGLLIIFTVISMVSGYWPWNKSRFEQIAEQNKIKERHRQKELEVAFQNAFDAAPQEVKGCTDGCREKYPDQTEKKWKIGQFCLYMCEEVKKNY